jgi:hypothetical protein
MFRPMKHLKRVPRHFQLFKMVSFLLPEDQKMSIIYAISIRYHWYLIVVLGNITRLNIPGINKEIKKGLIKPGSR